MEGVELYGPHFTYAALSVWAKMLYRVRALCPGEGGTCGMVVQGCFATPLKARCINGPNFPQIKSIPRFALLERILVADW